MDVLYAVCTQLPICGMPCLPLLTTNLNPPVLFTSDKGFIEQWAK